MATAHGERTRDRILEASLPLFAEHGFSGTSTRMVAQAAEVNVATIAYHFADKEGLYETVVQRLHAELAAAVPGIAANAPAADPSALLEWWVRAGWRFARDHRTHIRLLMRHVLDRGGHPDVILERWSGPLLDQAERIIAPLRPDWESPRRRLLVLSVQHLVARYVIEDPAQLVAMLGTDDEEGVEDAVVAFLTEMMGRLLEL